MKQIKIEIALLREVKGQHLKLNENGMFVYTSLRLLLKDDLATRLTYKSIYLSLRNDKNISVPTNIRNNIKDGLQQLVDNNFIALEQLDKSTLLIDPINMSIQKNIMFFSVPLENINKIMEQKNCIDLLYKYLYIVSTINLSSNIGFMSQINIAENLEVSTSTIKRAFKTFCDLEILFKSSRSSLNKKGEFINMTNIYSLDKECLGGNQYNIKAHKDLSDNVIDMDKYIDTNINRQNNDVYCNFSSCPF